MAETSGAYVCETITLKRGLSNMRTLEERLVVLFLLVALKIDLARSSTPLAPSEHTCLSTIVKMLASFGVTFETIITVNKASGKYTVA
jgi:hypothetical protein